MKWHTHVNDCIISFYYNEFFNHYEYIVEDESGNKKSFTIKSLAKDSDILKEAKAFAAKPDKDVDDWYPRVK